MKAQEEEHEAEYDPGPQWLSSGFLGAWVDMGRGDQESSTDHFRMPWSLHPAGPGSDGIG